MKNQIRYLITALFLVIGLFIVTIHILYGNIPWLLWFCNHVSFVLALGVFLRNRLIVTGELILGGIGQLFWVEDFITKYFFGVYTTRVSEYMFVQNYPTILFLTGLLHFVIFFLTIFSLYLLEGPSKDGWKFALIHGAIIWIISLFVFNIEQNINCAHISCVPFLPVFGYKFYWPLVYGLGVILPANYMLNKFWKH